MFSTPMKKHQRLAAGNTKSDNQAMKKAHRGGEAEKFGEPYKFTSQPWAIGIYHA
ncbi:MAG: hypothetical protein Q9195_002217 [Heterodermia aff. obscurata]